MPKLITAACVDMQATNPRPRFLAARTEATDAPPAGDVFPPTAPLVTSHQQRHFNYGATEQIAKSSAAPLPTIGKPW
jgi:hypothetical protein